MTIGEVRWSVGVDDHVSCLAVSPTGDRMVAGSLAGDVVVADTASGAVVAKLPSHPLGVLSASWSPDGSLVATGGQDNVLRLCRNDGATVAEVTAGAWVENLAWSRSGLLAASTGRSLLIVDRDGTVVHRYGPVSSTITAVSWSANATRVGVTSYGGITWYDVDRLPTDTPAREHRFKGSALALELAPNGKWACAGYQDASIHLWPLWSGADLSMSGYPAKIDHLAFRHDSQWLASACLDELTVWDFSRRGPKGRSPAVGNAHPARITWLGWQPDGDLLASGDQAGMLALWPSPTSVRKPLEPLHVSHDGEAVATAAWLPDGMSVIVGRHDGSVERLTLG